MDMTGAMVYVAGVSAVSRPRPPVVASTMIELARIANDWGRKPIVEPTGVRNVPYNEIQDMRRMLIDVYDLVAQERLKNDVTARDVGAKRGLFVDPLRNDAMRDQGIAQTAAVFGGKMRLPITPRLHTFPAFNGIKHLDFVEVSVIRQNRRSGAKNQPVSDVHADAWAGQCRAFDRHMDRQANRMDVTGNAGFRGGGRRIHHGYFAGTAGREDRRASCRSRVHPAA